MKIIDNLESGISVAGHVINMITYIDVTAVLANSQKRLQHLIDSLHKVTRESDVKINVKKDSDVHKLKGK